MSMIADALKSGVLKVDIDESFGWEWKRLYKPESKIAYLINQVAEQDLEEIAEEFGAYDGSPEEKMAALRERNSQVEELIDTLEEHTGCKIELNISGRYFGVDHESQGLGVDLLYNHDRLLDLLFSKDSYIQLGNDNRKAPEIMDTDIGRREDTYPYFYKTPDTSEGVPVTIEYGVGHPVMTVSTPDEEMYAETQFNFGGTFTDTLKDFHIQEVSAVVFRPEERRNYERINYDNPEVLKNMARRGLVDYLSGFDKSAGVIFDRDLVIDVEVKDAKKGSYGRNEPYFTLKGVCNPKCIDLVREELQEVVAHNAEFKR
jgi:hypothetical protein